jgi:hypothetical protein
MPLYSDPTLGPTCQSQVGKRTKVSFPFHRRLPLASGPSCRRKESETIVCLRRSAGLTSSPLSSLCRSSSLFRLPLRHEKKRASC